jgi:eukaryotic-like serine/threonine-protein kinase
MNGPDSELDAVGRVAEAFLARYRRGERPSLAEYTQKYPELAEQMRDLFPALVLMEEMGSVEGPRSASPAGTAPGTGKMPEQLGDYRILREVGRGGMGVVYEAVQESLGRHVALKVLSSHPLLPPTHLERFRREARAAARLHHTNIVPVYAVGAQDGVHYYAMQFIQGQGLDEVLKEVKRLRSKKGPLPAEDPEPGAGRSQGLAQGLLSGQFAGAGASGREGEAPGGPSVSPSPPASPGPPAASSAAGPASGTELTSQPEARYFRSVARMGVQVAAGLDYAHQQGILHRDIKPSNLLLDALGTVWITDFGLAKAEGSDELTHTGDIVGTLRYMAPERLQGRADRRSDVYGLGITLYELLTLRPAFEDSSRPRLIERVTREEPPRPRKVDRSIPRDLETIVLKATAKEPGRRYQTAAELAADLGRFLAGEPVRARRVGVWERGLKWVKRRPAVAALLAVSAAAVVTLIVGTLVYNARLEAALREARLAEREKTEQLAIAQVREAQARRNSGLVGRRFESLEALKKAAEHFRALGELDEGRTRELRNEAIACLALADLKRGEGWTRDPGWSAPLAFDSTLQYYVVHDERPEVRGYVNQGHLSVRRVSDRREVAHLPGSGTRVMRAEFSPDGRYLAAHYYDEAGTQRDNYVWDLGRCRPILKGPRHHESFPAFSPDSRRVAFPQPDQSIQVFELPSGTKWKDLPPGPPVRIVAFHPAGRRLAATSGSIVQLRDLDGGEAVATFHHPDTVASLAWRGDGKVLATGCWDQHIYLWDTANPARPLRTLEGHFAPVVNLSFSHGGDLLFSTSWDSTDRLWDPLTGRQLVSKPGGVYHEHSFGPDDQALDEGWQVATGRECRTFHGHKQPPRWVAISPAGRLMASVSLEGVYLWDLAATREGDKLLATLPVGPSLAVSFDPKGKSLITDSKSAGLQRWPIVPDPATGGLRIGPPQSPGLCAQAPLIWPGYDPDFVLSADGRTVAHCPGPGRVLLFDLENSRPKLLIESAALRHAAFSRDGRWLATGNWQGRGAKVWDARTGELAQDLDVGDPEEWAAWPAFSPDGEWLVIGTVAEYGFWEVGSWRKSHSLPRENAGKSRGQIVFSPDGTMLAVLRSMTEAALVDPATGREFARLPTAGGPYCFSPDGSQLVTHAGKDGALHVWDLRLIRRQLREMGLDWDLPPYPPPSANVKPLRVTVLAGERPPSSNELRAEAYLERGLLYLQSRKYRMAAADFDRARTHAPQRPPWEEVVRACSQLLERHPEDLNAYQMRAYAHDWLGQRQKTIEDCGQVIRRAPQLVEPRVYRGRAYLRLGQKDKAAEDLLQAGERSPEWANGLARELATSPNPALREPSLAVKVAKQAVRQAAGEPTYWNTLGIAHYRAREWRAAIEALEEAEKRAPGKYFGFNAFFLAMCHHQLGDPARARDHYDRAVRWAQENQGKLSAQQQQELKAFRAEAEALLKAPPPGP